MADIVERLREHGKIFDKMADEHLRHHYEDIRAQGFKQAELANALHAAADEIERLRAALSALLVEYVAGRKEGHIDSFPATAKKVVADARHALNIHHRGEK